MADIGEPLRRVHPEQIIQIAASNGCLWALCADGSLWVRYASEGGGWRQEPGPRVEKEGGV
jgi:hypothetical protein